MDDSKKLETVLVDAVEAVWTKSQFGSYGSETSGVSLGRGSGSVSLIDDCMDDNEEGTDKVDDVDDRPDEVDEAQVNVLLTSEISLGRGSVSVSAIDDGMDENEGTDKVDDVDDRVEEVDDEALADFLLTCDEG